MSDSFVGENTKSLGGLEREVEMRMKRLELVGVVNGKYGRVEIHKDTSKNIYHVLDSKHVMISTNYFGEAREYAQKVANRDHRGYLLKKLDAFRDVQPYQDAQKSDNGYQDKHTENLEADKTQESMDVLDEMEQMIEGGIKPKSTQFPKESASDNAGFDSRQVDPAKVSDMSFHERIENKLKKGNK